MFSGSKFGVDIPLDLTVRRIDMEDIVVSQGLKGSENFNRQEERRHSVPASVLEKKQQSRNSFSVTDPQSCRNQQTYSPTNFGSSVTPNFSVRPEVTSRVGVNTTSDTFETSSSPGPVLSTYNFENVHPKKRKNLWRPYDTGYDDDQDEDTSDSSSSSSDQEGKVDVAEIRIDPMKKRKMDMLKYADSLEQNDNASTLRPASSPPSPDVQMSDASAESSSNPLEYPSVKTDQEPFALSRINEDITKAQMALFTNFPESRDKLIAGMKKRDIFGWSLKLSSPEVEENSAEPETHSTNSSPTENVCQDGDKTYYELQTVKKSNTPSPVPTPASVSQGNSRTSSPTTTPKHTKQIRTAKRQAPSSPAPQSNTGEKKKQSVPKMDSAEKENVYSLPKVKVQGRQGILESTPVSLEKKKSTTQQSLSLIDLVEEIEAEAKEKEKSQNKHKSKNNGIAALLQQCNHVKVTALDFLMSSVLLGDKEKPYQAKNARLQQMLKGDKINSVSMLDVVELQVEVGLS